MKKMAFYIVERPIYASSSYSAGEFKEDETIENINLAPIEVGFSDYHLVHYR